MRRQLLGLGFVAASSLLAMQAANAMTGPQAISIDGGPLGSLSLSGGADGYGYYLGNAGQGSREQNTGAALGNAMIELQKTSGIVQFTVEVGANGNESLGALSYTKGHVSEAAVNNYVTGPLYAGYVTLAPSNLPVTISAGQLGSLEGYEGSFDWSNPSQFTTLLFYTENAQSRGVNVAYSQGPLSATVQFGDGSDSGVANFLQALVSYSFDANNTLNVFYGGNLGRTGANTFFYGNLTTAAAPYYYNSQLFGAYYSYTNGNLNLVPEVQYVYAKPQAYYSLDGMSKTSSAFGAALFGTYSLANTPYSLGGWVEYFNSRVGATDGNNFANWAIGPDAQAIGVALSPTWQYKDLFARANAGYIYLLRNKSAAGTTYGYGTGGHAKGQFMGTLEAGVLF
ncbi:hypothetical protein [Acidocella sp.]|uniref:hypothetical protein n=1 Tax=Acidocella sp. TaxID=50710 RepID=UPI002604D6AC|nr:hypothetical protein [Acidocella sp.]